MTWILNHGWNKEAFGADSVDLSISVSYNTTFTNRSLWVPTDPMERSDVENTAWDNTSAQRRRSLLTFLALAISKRARSLSWQQPEAQRSCLNGDTKLSHFMNNSEEVTWKTLVPLSETGRTVRLKSCRVTSFVFCTAWMARTWCCHALSHRRSNRCSGPADLQGFLYSLNHGHLSLQELVEDLLCRSRDIWKEEGLYLLLEMVRFVSLTPEE